MERYEERPSVDGPGYILSAPLIVRRWNQQKQQGQQKRQRQIQLLRHPIWSLYTIILACLILLVRSNPPHCEAFSTHASKHLHSLLPPQEWRTTWPNVCNSRAHQQAQYDGSRIGWRTFQLYQLNGHHQYNDMETSNDHPISHEQGKKLRNGSNHPRIYNELETTQHDKNNVPRHVAFVCDGNSRWAKARNVPTFVGHAAGADRLVEVLTALKNDGVQYCTMYGFSTENWRRSKKEIDDILTVMEQTARRFYDRALQERVRVKVLGDMHDERLPQSLRDILGQLERDTLKFGASATTETAATTSSDGNQDTNDRPTQPLTVCLAVNYGGRQDIVNASLKVARALANGEIDPEDVSEETFSSYLCTDDIPDPDLIIRTSGECRLSNFLLWNAAYAELYFTPVLWPDFAEDHWKAALTWYGERKRRFGAREKTHIEVASTP